MNRSEKNSITGKTVHEDLNMTNYPEKVDSRQSGESGYNENMKGFKNIHDFEDPDWSMAEHVNALADAVMSMQRVLGIMPHFDAEGLNKETVSNRIGVVESRNFDERYGGIDWVPEDGQTILGHRHTGGPLNPSQIMLSSEVSGALHKTNMNLSTSAQGLTGSDISVAHNNSTKIASALNNKLSVTDGGNVKGDVTFEERILTHTYAEWDAVSISGGSTTSDSRSYRGQVKRASGTGQTVFISENIDHLYSGKYVVGIRAKISSMISGDVLTVRYRDLTNAGTASTRNEISFSADDFDQTNEYKTLYMVFDRETKGSLNRGDLYLAKPSTSSSIAVDIDNVYITPVHPAVFDR